MSIVIENVVPKVVDFKMSSPESVKGNASGSNTVNSLESQQRNITFTCCLTTTEKAHDNESHQKI
jgi:hypothetical protein